MSRQRKLFYEFHEFRIDPEKRLLLRDQKVVPLAPKAFDTLLLLIHNHTRVVTIEEIWKEVWHGIFTTKNNINVHLSKIRKALGQGRNSHRCIETIERQGYRFACEVREVGDAAVEPLPEPQARPFATADQQVAGEGLPSLSDQNLLAEVTDGGQLVVTQADERVRVSAASKARHLSKPIGYDKRIIPRLLLILLAAAVIFSVVFYMSKPLPPPEVLHPRPITNDGCAKTNPILTDGLRLYFSEVVDGNKLLFQMVSTGGEIEKIPVPFANTALLDISPDRTELLVGSETTIETEMRLWLMKVPGSSPRPLGDLRAHAGAWSPDGRHIVYANGSKLYIANNDGNESRELVNIASGLPYNLRWSPDGQQVRFEVRDLHNRSTSLWEVRVDGTNLRPLLPGWNDPAAECCGNWTPDGKYFVFLATQNQVTSIWAIRERVGFLRRASHEPIQLTDGSLSFRSVIPSKDGQKLFAISEQRFGQLARYDARARQWVSYLPGISAEYLDFSIDGERIAYVTYPEGHLWISKVDGSDRRQLSFPPMRAYSPRWSPDGRQVAFAAMSPGKRWKIYLISTEGGRPEPIMPGDENEYGPFWSPDGGTLAFWKGERALGTTAIYLFDLKTQQVSMLPGSEGLYAPRWSPKGGYIAAMPDDAKSIMRYDLKEGTWNELVRMNVGSPSWSGDGKYIYFRSIYQDDPAVFRVRSSDRKLEHWAPLKDPRRASGIFGQWMGLAPDDSVLVLRDEGMQNIYAFDWMSP